jgi:outer membrane beta-barrel protein
MKRGSLSFALLFSGLVSGLGFIVTPATASAQEEKRRVSPLEGAPAVRHRLELREKRFEIGAGIGGSIAHEFYHAFMVNVKAGFHITDWLAIGAGLSHSLLPDIETGLTTKLVDSLKERGADDMVRAPSDVEALGAMNQVAQTMSLQGEITPFSGKFGLFSKVFANYDLYLLGGVGFINFKADLEKCGTMAAASCPDTGLKTGPIVGLGFHAFINDFAAINVELRDIMVSTNRSGRDVNADGKTDKNDSGLTQNFFLGLNVTFFLPGKASISD